MTDQIIIREFSRRGDPIVFERGGASSSGGDADVWCGANGEKLRPLFVLSHGHLSNADHAAFLIKSGMVRVQAHWHRSGTQITIQQVTKITRADDEHGKKVVAECISLLPAFTYEPRFLDMADAVKAEQALPQGFHIGDKVEAQIDFIDYLGMDVLFSGNRGRIKWDSEKFPIPAVNSFPYEVGQKIYPYIKGTTGLYEKVTELTMYEDTSVIPAINGTALEKKFAQAVEAAKCKAHNYHCRSVYFADTRRR